jgi:hypothetical protein
LDFYNLKDCCVTAFTKFVTNDVTMTTTAIRKKLTDYLQVADDKKIKAIYAMVEDEIGTLENDWDEAFVNEMNARIKAYETGEATTYTLNEAENIARQTYKANKK